MLKVGDQAPDFKLFDTQKKEISLQDYKGKNLVVLFFPLAFTSTYTKELCSVRDDYSTYEQLNAEVVGISVDSLFTLDRFKQEQNLNFPLLSDFNKDAAAAYGALYKDFVFGMKGVSKRAAFVVGEDGKIKYAEVLESAGDLPSFEGIKQALSSN